METTDMNSATPAVLCVTAGRLDIGACTAAPLKRSYQGQRLHS